MALWKPMLADNKIPTLDQIRFPVFVSPKLDGIRCTVQNGALYSRSLKLIPNKQVQEKFRELPDGMDGELIVGDPTNDPYRRTVSVVMSEDEPADDVFYYVFDKFSGNLTFDARKDQLYRYQEGFNFPGVRYVPHFLCHMRETLEMAEQEYLTQGFEGAMLNDPNGTYKQGRSTIKEGKLLKLKRFEDAEAKIVGFVEEQQNTNEAKTNELGRTERSSHKAGMVGKGTLGALEVVGVGAFDGMKFNIGGGFTQELKRQLWAQREELLGKLVVYKHFPIGNYDLPRMPIFKGLRDKRDL